MTEQSVEEKIMELAGDMMSEMLPVGAIMAVMAFTFRMFNYYTIELPFRIGRQNR